MSNGEEQRFEGELIPGLQDEREKALSQVQAEEPTEIGQYEQRARRYFNKYAMQFTVSGQLMPSGIWDLPGSEAIPRKDPTAFTPSPPRSARQIAVRALGQQLLNTGYLRNSAAANDPNSVFNALTNVHEDAEHFGYKDVDQYLTDLIQTGGGIGAQKNEFTPEPFIKPALQRKHPAEVESAIERGVTSILGRAPTDEELDRVMTEFRQLEEVEHTDEIQAARTAHEAREKFRRRRFEGGGTEGVPSEVTVGPITGPPDPRTLAEERFEDTDEAKAFHGARLGLDLLSALRGGF